jgi:hypothetical protein
MIDKEQVAALLGRPLTPQEDTSFDVYIAIAEAQLQSLLCMDITSASDTRIFRSREGYSTLFIDPVTDITSVTIDGVAVTDYTMKQNDSYQADWFNVLEFDRQLGDEKVTIEASWGFTELPDELAYLLAQLFKVTSSTKDSQVRSKSIEDFSVTYTDTTVYDQMLLDNQSIIYKYAQCDGAILHGGW